MSERVQIAQNRLNAKWLRECHQLLTDAGVPEAVELVGEPVPTNTVPGRLKWYLLRRKDVARHELDDADIAWLRHERMMNTPYGSPRGKI